jgi:hypothetical protein
MPTTPPSQFDKGKGKAKASSGISSDSASAVPNLTMPQTPPPRHRRRSSIYYSPADDGIPRPPLLSPSFAAREELCVNIGSDEYPRLVTLVTATQGYEFNKALFLPPRFVRDSAEYNEYEAMRDRDTEVVDVLVTEEETKAMFLE